MITTASSLRWPAAGVRSLAWDGDELVDWVSGGRRHRLDGSTVDPLVGWGYPFDAALTLAGSSFAVIYTRTATKGLVLREGRIVREINRSHYHADAYEYPVALARLPSGREVLVHCPDDYCRLDVEDLATGERLTCAASRQPGDCFHSRLEVSPDGRFLSSAGWVWHPLDQVQLYDLQVALNDPRHLDGRGIAVDAWADQSSASFLPDGRVAIWLMSYDDEEGAGSAAGELRIVDPRRPAAADVKPSVGRLGTLLAVDNDHVMALHGHPRLIELATGEVVRSWPEVTSGQQTSSILVNSETPPPVALDRAGRRCAMADDTAITVVRW